MASSERKRPESCAPIYILQSLKAIKKDSGKTNTDNTFSKDYNKTKKRKQNKN